MLCLILKAAVSGVIIAIVSETAMRSPGAFWSAPGAGCVLTIGLYVGTTAVGPRFGRKL